MPEFNRTLVSVIGLASQFAASVLLVILYALLGRERRGRGFFRLWGRAWLVLMLTLGVLVLRYQILPEVHAPLADGPLVHLTIFGVYQLGKLLWCALLLAGTAQYAHRVRRPWVLALLVAGAAVYSLITAARSSSIREVMIWQSPIAAAALASCAVLMLGLPPARRTLGSRFTGAAFAANALLWATYGPAFYFTLGQPAVRPPLLDFIVSANSFLDQILAMALGYGMVVVLLEDAKREVDAAHAELSLAHQELRGAAMFDPLTGALNRRAFEHSLGLEAGWASFGAVGMLDLDDLKAVNDNLGHATGDMLLRRLADEMRAGLRPSDKLYRWGGDEFLLVMPGASAADLMRRVAIILHAADDPPLLVSGGAADYESTDAMEPAIAKADRAMYQEKMRRKLPSISDATVVA